MYVDCVCCGVDIVGIPGDRCDGCHPDSTFDDYEQCDFSQTWHCFTAHCDGSGCTYSGECEVASVRG